MRNQLRYEKQYSRVLKKIFKQQETDAIHSLAAHSSSFKTFTPITRSSNLKLFDDAYYDELMVSKLQPTLQDLAKTQGGLAMVFAGGDPNEFHLTSQILAILTKNTAKMATGYNDETLDQLNATLAEGVQSGEGIGKLTDRVKEVYGDVYNYRSTRVARTETLKASNNATVDAYRQTGFVKNKVWVVNPDACPQCEAFDGKSLPLDDSFLPLGSSYTVTDDGGNEVTYTNSYDTVEEPPLHPNCRCTIIPEA